jgi:urocanate hydratase
MGVIRHVDAGYEDAVDAAARGGLRLPSVPRDA